MTKLVFAGAVLNLGISLVFHDWTAAVGWTSATLGWALVVAGE